jgi:hypothetical protein
MAALLRYTALLAAMAFPALADCQPPWETFMSCEIEGSGKRLEVCFDRQAAAYNFGPQSAPELELIYPIAELAYRPWPGVGSSIWEEIDFPHAGHLYTVSAGIDRRVREDETEPPRLWGGVEVRKGAQVLATLQCAPETVAFSWSQGLYEAKEAAGFSWDYSRHEWVRYAGE